MQIVSECDEIAASLFQAMTDGDRAAVFVADDRGFIPRGPVHAYARRHLHDYTGSAQIIDNVTDALIDCQRACRVVQSSR